MFTISVGMPGPFELMIILAIVLILFGAGKLPKVLGQMGKGVKAFKEGLSGQGENGEDAVDVTPDDEDEVQKAIDQEDEPRSSAKPRMPKKSRQRTSKRRVSRPSAVPRPVLGSHWEYSPPERRPRDPA